MLLFGKTGSDKEYSVAVEASGLVNVISILAAIFDEGIKVLLIDEPEVSLHPQLQSYLLREIKSAANRYNKANWHWCLVFYIKYLPKKNFFPI